MFSDTGSLVSIITLTVTIMGVMQATLAMPAMQDTTHKLVITSNIEPGIMYEDALGPFIIGKDLTITCSTEDSKAVSWWEGDKQMPTVVTIVNDTTICNFNVGILQQKDSMRHFTCRELVSRTEKSVDLQVINDHLEIQKDGHPLENEHTLKVFVGTNFRLDCIVRGSEPSTGTWWEDKKVLRARRTVSGNAIKNQISLRPTVEDNGRKLTCWAWNGQLTKSVVLNVVEDEQGVFQPPAADAPITTGTPAKTSSSTNIVRTVVTTTTDEEGVTAYTMVGQKTHAFEGVSKEISMQISTTGKPEKNVYLIAGVAAITFIGFVVVVLIFVMLKLCRKIDTMGNTISQPHGNSSEQQARAGTSGQSTLENLLSGHPGVEECNGTTTSGGRMSLMLDDRDHSYYYPDLINNSYYYPKPTYNPYLVRDI